MANVNTDLFKLVWSSTVAFGVSQMEKWIDLFISRYEIFSLFSFFLQFTAV